MGVKCQIKKDRVGNITRVEARNGAESNLYKAALEMTGDQQEALDLWTVNYVQDFQENVLTPIQGQESSRIQRELDKIQPKTPLNLNYSLERVSDSEIRVDFKKNPSRKDAPDPQI